MNLALVLAAGRSRRFGSGVPKQFTKLRGKPVLLHSVEQFICHQDVDSYAVVTSEEYRSRIEDLLSSLPHDPEFLQEGGETRRDSVRKGLTRAEDLSPETVLVHDSARPGVTEGIIDRLFNLYRERSDIQGVIPVLPVRNTIKQVNDIDDVERTLNRDHLRQVQTPQLFGYKIIHRIHREWNENDANVTDDAMMVEFEGGTVSTVKGSRFNMKITYPEDLTILESLIRFREED
ncbi:MAG: 2-C-methyl-D-erythritol 4-phosphate cytidylyltransferase [bacterium]